MKKCKPTKSITKIVIYLLSSFLFVAFVFNTILLHRLDNDQDASKNLPPRRIHTSTTKRKDRIAVYHNKTSTSSRHRQFVNERWIGLPRNMTMNHKSSTTGYRPRLIDIFDDIYFRKKKDAGQFLLDFAIIGNGKCGTTSLQIWLANHSEITIPKQEILTLSMKTPKHFMSLIYQQFPNKTIMPSPQSTNTTMMYPIKSGYKSPLDIRVPHAIQALAKYFPKTTLLIGIRHPVLWFESLYNFKVQNIPKRLPSNYWGHPNKLIGKCIKPMEFNCVGTHKGLFHVYLAYLGKTIRTNTTSIQMLEELYPEILLPSNDTVKPPLSIESSNPIFLFDVQQLQDSMETIPSTNIGNTASDDDQLRRNQRGRQFRRDVQTILDLHIPLGPPPKKIPGKVWNNTKLQQERDALKINICDTEYIPLRIALMKISIEASEWIRYSGFLNSSDVHVSSRNYFENVILGQQWMNDPCDKSSK